MYQLFYETTNFTLSQDFTGSFRKKEEKYMYRTDEAIYQRAQEAQIKRPPDWEAEEIDSVRVSNVRQKSPFNLQSP